MNRKTKRLLRQYDGLIRRVSHVLVDRFGEGESHRLAGEIRDEYVRIIPQLPDIGGIQPFQQFVIGTGWALAMYRVGMREGWPVEQSGQLVYDVTEAYLKSFPAFVHRLLGWFTNTAVYRFATRRQAARSQRRKYPGDYVFKYINSGGGFDYGVDYLECASCKFLRQKNGMPIAPYLCTTDILYSRLWGWGLHRSGTIAGGAERCDFRFKKGGETRVEVFVPLIDRQND